MADRTIYGSHFVCRTLLRIEGQEMGPVVGLHASFSRKNISAECRIELPFHLIRFKEGERYYTSGSRVTPEAVRLRTGSAVEVVAWYESWGRELSRLTVFKGYVREVVDGYPAVLVCEDLSFPLKFGQINRDWKSATQLQVAVRECIEIGNAAFLAYRREKGLTHDAGFTPLSLAESESAEAEFNLGIYTGVSPYHAIANIIKLWNIYTNVDDAGRFYVGMGFTKASPETPTVRLSGAVNVVERNIVPQSAQFENYQVIVNGFKKDGGKISAQVGDSNGEKVELSRLSLQTPEGIENLAKAVMNELKAQKNSGTLTILLYPWVNVLDYVAYDDTVFDSFSGEYYVTGKSLSIGEGGFRQVLDVTNQKYAL